MATQAGRVNGTESATRRRTYVPAAVVVRLKAFSNVPRKAQTHGLGIGILKVSSPSVISSHFSMCPLVGVSVVVTWVGWYVGWGRGPSGMCGKSVQHRRGGVRQTLAVTLTGTAAYGFEHESCD